MKPKTVEALVWVLVYSGMLIAALGLFLRDAEPLVSLILIVLGLSDAAAGVVLIVWRSRMTNPSKEKP